jgi:hypothetical protein
VSVYRGNGGRVKRLVEEVEQMDRLDAHLIARRPPSGGTPSLGWHRAVCVDVWDCGEVTNRYGTSHLVEFTWELEERREDGKRHLAWRKFRPTLADSSVLRQFLEVWMGRPFSIPELLDGVDLPQLCVGRDGQLLLEMSPTSKFYRKIVAATPRAAYSDPVLPDGLYIRKLWRAAGKQRTPAGPAIVPDESTD